MKRRLLRFFLWMLGILLLPGVGAYVYMRTGTLNRHITQTVEWQLRKRSGFPVTVGGFYWDLNEGLTLRDITVYESDGETPIVRLGRIYVSSVGDKWLRKVVNIPFLEVHDAEVHLRREKDKPFSLETVLNNLLGEPTEPGKPAAVTVNLGNIQVEGARLTIDDKGANLSGELKDIELKSDGVAKENGMVFLPADAPRDFILKTGKGSFKQGEAAQTIDGVDADLNLSPKQILLKRAEVRTGQSKVALRGSVALSKKILLDCLVDADLRLADLRGLNDAALSKVAGNLVVAAKVTGDVADPAFRGRWSLSRGVYGKMKLPILRGAVDGNLRGVAVRKIVGQYAGGILRGNAAVSLEKGGKTQADIAVQNLDVGLLRKNLAPEQTALEPLSGRLSGSATVTLGEKTMESAGAWTLNGVAWEGRRFQPTTSTFRHTVADNRFTVRGDIARAAIEAEGTLPEAGKPLDILFHAKTDNVQALASAFGAKATGKATVDGTVGGKLDDSTTTFRVLLAQATFGLNGGAGGPRPVYIATLPIASLMAAGTFQGNRLDLKSATLNSGNGSVRATGSVLLPKKKKETLRLDMRVIASNFDLTPYLHAFAPDVPATALADADLRLQGFVDRLDASGAATVKQTTYDEIPFIVESFSIAGKGGRFQIPDLRVAFGEVRAVGSATVDAKTYSFRAGLEKPVTIRQFLAAFPEKKRPKVEGVSALVNVTAEGKGSFEKPSASARITLDETKLALGAGRAPLLGHSDIEASYENRDLRVKASLADNRVRGELTGRLEEKTLPFQGKFRVSDENLLKLIPQKVGALESVALGGEFSVEGDAMNWEKTLLGTLAVERLDARAPNGRLIARKPLLAEMSPTRVTIRQFQLESADASRPFLMTAEGTLDAKNPSDLTLNIPKYDLTLVSGFVGVSPKATGTGNLRVHLTGTTDDPTIQVEGEIPEALADISPPNGEGKGGERLRPEPLSIRQIVTRLHYRNQSVHLDDVRADIAGNRVTAAGSFELRVASNEFPEQPSEQKETYNSQLALRHSKLDTRNSKLDLRLTGDFRDFAWLRLLDPTMKEVRGSGKMELALRGTFDRPDVSGTVSLNSDTISVESLATPITNLKADVALKTWDAETHGSAPLLEIAGNASANLDTAAFQARTTATYPLDLDRLSDKNAGDALRAIVDADFSGILVREMVAALKMKPVPVDGVAEGSARVEIAGLKPETWRGEARMSKLVIVGNGRSLKNQGTLVAQFDGKRVRFGKAAFYAGNTPSDSVPKVTAAGSVGLDGSLDVELTGAGIGLEMAQGFLPESLLTEQKRSVSSKTMRKSRIGGMLDVHAKVAGTAAKPTFQADWTLKNAYLDRMTLDSFTGAVAYANETVTLSNWRLQSYGNLLTAAGTIPVSIGVEETTDRTGREKPPVRLLDRPMKVEIQTDGFDLNFLPLVAPMVAEASGIAEAKMTVEGTPVKPALRGHAAIPKGSFLLADSGARIEDVAFSLQAAPTEIAVKELNFRVGLAHYSLSQTNLQMDGLTPTSLRASLSFTDAAAEAWLPMPLSPAGKGGGTPTFQSRFNGTVFAALDLARLRDERREMRQTAQTRSGKSPSPMEQAVFLSRFVNGTIRLDKVNVDSMGYFLRNAQPIAMNFEKGQLRLFRADDPSSAANGGGEVQIVHDTSRNPANELRLTLGGTWDVGEALNFHIRGTAAASGFNDMLKKTFDPTKGAPAIALNGRIQFEAKVTGSETDPQITLTTTGENFLVNRVTVPTLRFQAEYAKDVLRITQGELGVSGNVVRIGGQIPMRIAPAQGEVKLLEQDLAITADCEPMNLDFLPLLAPTIAQAGGRGRIHVTVGGRLDAPTYKGAIEASNVSLGIPANHLQLTNTTFRLTLAENRLLIDAFNGTINDGTFRITGAGGKSAGVVTLEKGVPKQVALAVSLRGTNFFDPTMYETVLDADLNLSGPVERIRVTGNVAPSEVRFTQDWEDFIAQNFQAATRAVREQAKFNYPVLNGMTLDIAAQADRNIRVDTGPVKAEAGFEGRVVGPLSKPIFVGGVTLIEGEFDYLSRKFTIESGRADNTNTADFNPIYSVVAVTADNVQGLIPDTQGNVQSRSAKVRVTLSGTLRQPLPPDFQLTVINAAPGEDFYLTPQQYIALLTVGDATAASAERLQGVGVTLAERAGEAAIANQVAQRLGFSEVQLDLETEDIESSKFSVTRELSSRFAVTLESTLQLDRERRIEVEYKIRKGVSISGERNEHGKYGLDAKLGFEFR